MRIHRYSGFTLIELMIVVSIIAMLAMIAIPAYNDSVTKARRADGMSALMDAMARQERFFTENNSYTTDLGQASISANSQEGYYTVSAAACGSGITSCVIITAAPTSAQLHDGALTLNSRGQRTPAEKW